MKKRLLVICFLIVFTISAFIPFLYNSDVRCPQSEIVVQSIDGENSTITFHVPDGYQASNTQFVTKINETSLKIRTDETERFRITSSGNYAYVPHPVRTSPLLKRGCRPMYNFDSMSVVQTQDTLYMSKHNLNIATISDSSNHVRVVAPREALESSVSNIALDVSSQAATLSRGDGLKNNITLFYIPSSDPTDVRGYAHDLGNSSEAWVATDEHGGLKVSTWYHETIHQQQNYTAGDDFKWFREASAEYIAALYSANRNPGEYSVQFTRYALPRIEYASGEKSVLANESTWREETPYFKGGRVLLYIDVQLRNYSEKTIIDVFQWVNEHEGTVNYTDFREYFASHASEDSARRLDYYVKSRVEVGIASFSFPDDEYLSRTPLERVQVVTVERSEQYIISP